MLIQSGGIEIEHYKDLLDNGQKTNLDDFCKEMVSLNFRNSVFIDCTASPDVAKLYKKLFNSYVSVVTANKIACSSAYSNYKDLKNTAQSRGVRFIFETAIEN